MPVALHNPSPDPDGVAEPVPQDTGNASVLATLQRLDQEFARILDIPADTSTAAEELGQCGDIGTAAAEPIFVTRPFLPPFEEFEPLLRRIWQTRILTNGGPFHQELEARLRGHLGVPQVALFNNATTALMVALRSLDLLGEVITTPYSFVATSHALNRTENATDAEPFRIQPACRRRGPRRAGGGLQPATPAADAAPVRGRRARADA
ncbi:hypothetical protein OICFNHDK_0243 [Methylobacterium bullatum]|uniref:DegT/DnrJ/EryC1/StrS aminotransferase family protein n=1 Tax=Methylobacterium bullatum TaxID=570505 RepID=A0AAV4Z0Z3_9HYPH|nr:hypothetical protein OICFNHDK_0243 [Methylobacterium bullatum]